MLMKEELKAYKDAEEAREARSQEPEKMNDRMDSDHESIHEGTSTDISGQRGGSEERQRRRESCGVSSTTCCS